jgi:hypothetical protein
MRPILSQLQLKAFSKRFLNRCLHILCKCLEQHKQNFIFQLSISAKEMISSITENQISVFEGTLYSRMQNVVAFARRRLNLFTDIKKVN